jgi:uncharacterized membrane protein YhhN
MKNTIISASYFMLAIIFISFGSMVSPLVALILKALIIPLLMFLMILNLKTSEKRSNQLIILALIFSWLGDILLGVPESSANLFVPGLISFLLAHVMYMLVFFRTPGKNLIIPKRIYFLIPVLLYGIGLLVLLFNSLGEMKLPVTVYTLVILTMVCSAISRYGKVNITSWLLISTGAILFLISDSGIAINKFSSHFAGAQAIIMSTYVLAQYLIVIGYIMEFKTRE